MILSLRGRGQDDPQMAPPLSTGSAEPQYVSGEVVGSVIQGMFYPKQPEKYCWYARSVAECGAGAMRMGWKSATAPQLSGGSRVRRALDEAVIDVLSERH